MRRSTQRRGANWKRGCSRTSPAPKRRRARRREGAGPRSSPHSRSPSAPSLAVGNPQAIVPAQEASQGASAHGVNAGSVDGLVERLAARMRENPDDSQGWRLLARSYGALGRFNEAAQAYAKAAARLPGDAGVLADYAESLAMAQGGRLQGEPEGIIERALAADPGNLKAHALGGSAAFGKEDYAGAIRHWERMLPLVPPESESARRVQASIAEARSR